MNQIIIQLQLKKISYRGANIGHDVIFEFNSGPRMQRFRKTIPHGNDANFDDEIFTFLIDPDKPSFFSFDVTVTEFDRRSPDVSQKRILLQIDPVAGIQKAHRFSVEVAEAP